MDCSFAWDDRLVHASVSWKLELAGSNQVSNYSPLTFCLGRYSWSAGRVMILWSSGVKLAYYFCRYFHVRGMH